MGIRRRHRRNLGSRHHASDRISPDNLTYLAKLARIREVLPTTPVLNPPHGANVHAPLNLFTNAAPSKGQQREPRQGTVTIRLFHFA
jgi:hypothetical protein